MVDPRGWVTCRRLHQLNARLFLKPEAEHLCPTRGLFLKPGQYFSQVSQPQIAVVGRFLLTNFNPSGLIYNLTYFLLVVGFTYFYTAVTFNPAKIADEIKKHGAFIPGIRPGVATAGFLNYILVRVTLAGALFLGAIAILPSIVSQMTGLTTLVLGGTGLLIVVSVIMDTAKSFESKLIERSYEGFLKK